MPKLTEWEQKLFDMITNWLDNDEEVQRFKKIAYPTKKQQRVHTVRRKRRTLAFVEVFKMLLAGGTYHMFGKIVHEKSDVEITTIEVDATSIMAVICGQIDKALGYKPDDKTPPKEEKHYTHS